MKMTRQEYAEKMAAEYGPVPFALALLADAVQCEMVDESETARAILSGGLDLYITRLLTIHGHLGNHSAVAQLSDIVGTLRAARG